MLIVNFCKVLFSNPVKITTIIRKAGKTGWWMQKSKFPIFTKKMQPLPNLIIIAAFILMGIGFLIPVVRITGKTGGMWGRPSISPFFFYGAKITMFLSWGLFLFKAIVPSFGCIAVPSWMAWHFWLPPFSFLNCLIYFW